VGVGGVLPVLHAYAQCGQWAPGTLRTWAPGLLALCLASAFASGLSDEESDRAGGKRTFTTWLGNSAVRRASDGLLSMGAVFWISRGTLGFLAALPVLFFGVRAWRKSPEAVTNAFAAQGAYKLELHRAIWWGTLVLASLVLMDRWGGAR
jgi:1,4-dihydroxy-2-naphthoate octaprenyltransferase